MSEKYYYYNELGEVSPVLISETEILDKYWEFFKTEGLKAIKRPNCYAYNKPELITKENCIDNWVVTNWAWEKKDED